MEHPVALIAGAVPSNASKAVGECLRKHGDEIQKKYERGEFPLDKAAMSILKKQAYESFSKGLSELCRAFKDSMFTPADTSDPTMYSLAISMFMIQKIAEAAKNAGSTQRETKLYIVYGEMFIMKTYGESVRV